MTSLEWYDKCGPLYVPASLTVEQVEQARQQLIRHRNVIDLNTVDGVIVEIGA